MGNLETSLLLKISDLRFLGLDNGSGIGALKRRYQDRHGTKGLMGRTMLYVLVIYQARKTVFDHISKHREEN